MLITAVVVAGVDRGDGLGCPGLGWAGVGVLAVLMAGSGDIMR
jgi:hypothetical protein